MCYIIIIGKLLSGRNFYELEMSPVFAASKPEIQVHPLGISGKKSPARLVFGGVSGEGIEVSMIDMGNRFRLVCTKITLVQQLEMLDVHADLKK